MARHPQQLVSSSTLMVLLKRVIKRACSIRWTTSRHGTFLASWDFRYLFHHLCYTVFLLVFYCCCYGCGRARVLVIRPAALLLSNFNVRIYFWNGMQHYLMMFGGTISVPFILTPALCIEEDDPVRSAIVSTIIFVSGIVTHTGRHVLLPGADVRHPQFARMAVPGSAGPRQHDLRG